MNTENLGIRRGFLLYNENHATVAWFNKAGLKSKLRRLLPSRQAVPPSSRRKAYNCVAHSCATVSIRAMPEMKYRQLRGGYLLTAFAVAASWAGRAVRTAYTFSFSFGFINITRGKPHNQNDYGNYNNVSHCVSLAFLSSLAQRKITVKTIASTAISPGTNPAARLPVVIKVPI